MNLRTFLFRPTHNYFSMVRMLEKMKIKSLTSVQSCIKDGLETVGLLRLGWAATLKTLGWRRPHISNSVRTIEKFTAFKHDLSLVSTLNKSLSFNQNVNSCFKHQNLNKYNRKMFFDGNIEMIIQIKCLKWFAKLRKFTRLKI